MDLIQDVYFNHDSYLSFSDILADAQHNEHGSLAKLYKYFQSIIMCMPGNVYWLDASCYTVGCNQNVLNMFGMTDIKQFQGLSFEDMARIGDWTKAQGDKFERDTKEVLQSGKPKPNEEEPPIPGSDGIDIFFLTTRVPLFDHNGKVIGVVGISTDITERKQREKALLLAKEEAERANSVKDRFIMNMEHDFRTPFNGICGLAGLLYEQEQDPHKKESLNMIMVSAKELLDYYASILDFSRIEQGMLPIYDKKFDLHALLQRVIRVEHPAAHQKGLDLLLHMVDGLPKAICGDDYRLFRVLINLVSNAVKFTDAGHVSLSVECVRAANAAREVVLTFKVADTGIGIRSEQKAYIFEKFTRTSHASEGKHRGLGLGLRSVKQFTHEMDGEIEVHSTPQKGTIFCCTYPFKLPLTDHLYPTTQEGT